MKHFLLLLASATSLIAHVPHDIIYSLGVSPDYANDGLVFSSSTQFGEAHLVSDNRGETFAESHAGMQRTLVTGHVFSADFKRDGIVYLTTRNGYYKSTDRGRNWVKQSVFADEETLSLCLSKDGSIYILTKTGLHLVPGNGGKLRTLKSHDEVTFGKLELHGQKLFVHRVHYPAVKKQKGMERVEYDSGTVHVLDLNSGKWSELAKRFKSTIIADFDLSKDGSSIVVSLKAGGVFLSGDAGKSWKEIHRRPSGFVCKVRFSPSYAEDGTIACGTSEGFIRLSTDRGENWELRSNGLSRWVHHVNILINHLEFSPDYRNDKTIFLGKTSGLHKTTDAGKTWRHVNVWNTKWGYFVLPAPGTDDVFAATYNSGISRSHDGGKTWASANIGISSAFANGMQLSPNYEEDQTIFVVDIGTGLYRSQNAGRSWSAVKELDLSKHYDQPVLYRKLGISSRFKDDGLMFLFTVPRKILGLPEKHVWKYNDKTKELNRITIGKSVNYINGFAFTPKESSRKRMFAATARGLYRSDDQGETWQVCKSGNFAKVMVSPDARANGLIYAMDGAGRIHASNDAGESFRFIRFNLSGNEVENLTFSPNFSTDRTLYATTFGQGLFRSQDAGKTWDYFALLGKHLFSGPSFSPNFANDRTMFAPAVDGIYRSADGGKNWKNVLQWTQFLPKVPFLILRAPDGRQIPLTYNVPEDMKRYGVLDPEAVGKVFEPLGNRSRKLKTPQAYLASYYKLNVDAGYAIEVNFFGDAIEYKCIKGPDLGIVDIVLDGKSHGEFDLYADQETFDVTGFRETGLKPGFHTLRIVNTGKKNKNSRGTSMTFNAANVRN